MTPPPGAWPTREEIAEMVAAVCAYIGWAYNGVFVDALHERLSARLRPAFDALTAEITALRHQHDAMVSQKTEHVAKIQQLRADLKRAHEDLAACVAALSLAIEKKRIIHAYGCWRWTIDAKGRQVVEEGSCVDGCELAMARAALARCGVQAVKL